MCNASDDKARAQSVYEFVLHRIYHEDLLLTQRTYNFLTVNVFLGALAVIVYSSQGPRDFVWLLAGIGTVLGAFQIAFGRRMETAIKFWREYAKLLERIHELPVDSMLFQFYKTASVCTPWGHIEAKRRGAGRSPLPVYRAVPWCWVPSTNTIVGVFVPWLLVALWLSIGAFEVFRRGHTTLGILVLLLIAVVTCLTWCWPVPGLPEAVEKPRT